MASLSVLITSLIFIGALSFQKTEAGIIDNAIDGIGRGVWYVTIGARAIVQQSTNPPRNRNSSIQYVLYTPSSPQEPCYLEQTRKALQRCPFNETHPLKILMHGFLADKPLLFEMKNDMTKLYAQNVILMDWTKYNKPPYALAALNSQLVGHELGKFIRFLQRRKGVDPQKVHLIGHSLGAQVAGKAGSETPNLGRISGLDPAYPLFSSVSLFHRLTYKDAAFVDIIHSGISLLVNPSGLGTPEPIGHQDFYPNGGYDQPECVGNKSSTTPEPDETLEGRTAQDPIGLQKTLCDHLAAMVFYMESVDPSVCVFRSVQCDSYQDFRTGACSNGSNLVTEMGFPAQPITGLPPTTKFYLRTGANPPYCLEDGYMPE